MVNNKIPQLTKVVLNRIQQRHTLCTILKRNFCQAQEEEKHMVDYDSFLKVSKTGLASKEAIISTLRLPRNHVENVVKEYPLLKKTSLKDILFNYQISINHSVSKYTLREHVYLLAHSDDDLYKKICILKNYGLPMDDAILFAGMTVTQITDFLLHCTTEGFKPVNKIRMLCDKLKVEDVKSICLYFRKNRFIRSQKMPILKTKLMLLIDNNFTADAILADGCALYYSVDKMKYKLDLIQKLGIKDKRLWMIRATEKELEKHANRCADLNDSNFESYISENFNIKPEEIKYMMEKNEVLTHISLSKLKKIVELMTEYNIDPSWCIFSARVFLRSPKNLRNRVKRVKEKFGILPYRPYFLMLTGEKFELYLQRDTL